MVSVSGGTVAGRFEIEGKAAAGGMGVVYQALDRETGERVALKLLQQIDTESLARFAREAGILAQLIHPAIVRYVANGETDDGVPFIAMEWVEGETLHARIERGALAVDQSVAAARRVAEALGYAHARGIVHRDVKPGNLILRGRELERIAVLDFGIARVAAHVGSLTDTGAMLGTPSYMAPEQARGERAVGAPADVFSLGCVLYECVTGQRAFGGQHMLALVAKVALWEPPNPRALDPGLSPELADLIEQMMAKSPAARPPDGNAAAALLAALPPDPRTARSRKSRSRTPSTQLSGRTRMASIVVAADPRAASGVAIERPDLKAALPGVRVDQLGDGSAIAVLVGDGSPPELVRRALATARGLRDKLPGDLIAIATGDIAAEGEPVTLAIGLLLEKTVATLAREAMAMLFAGVTTAVRPRGAIRLDDRTAQLAAPAEIVRVGASWYAGGE